MNYSSCRYNPAALLWVILLFSNFVLPEPCPALEPAEILVIANRNAARSVGLAKYYMIKRNIPEKNLVKVWVTDKETCSRSDYEKKILPPVRRYLTQKNQKNGIRCLLIMYGLPLRISAPELTWAEKEYRENLLKRQQELTRRLNALKGVKGENQKRIEESLKHIEKKLSALKESGGEASSSLDSEIALVLEKEYPLPGWTPNPYFLGNKDKSSSIKKDNVLMVSRLDGPTAMDVKRIIDDSIIAEKQGLNGTAYFDARWPDPGNKKLSGYSFYDHSIYRAADRVNKSGLMPVKIESTKELFQPGDCPDTALYCGWYSLANYIDAFAWQTGSIGYHIASSECATLKNKQSRVWCKMMIEKGVAATVGPVGEPYVQAFPVPEIFFGFLADGYLSLAECYLISTPFLSWQMVLIGDPLYRPFKNRK